jgi:hypothetical protein
MARFQVRNIGSDYVISAVLFDGTQESVGEINKMVEDEGRTNIMVEYFLDDDGNLEEHVFKKEGVLHETNIYEPGTYISSDVAFPMTQEELDQNKNWTMLGGPSGGTRFWENGEAGNFQINSNNVGNPEDYNKPGGQIYLTRSVPHPPVIEEGGEVVENETVTTDADGNEKKSVSRGTDPEAVNASLEEESADVETTNATEGRVDSFSSSKATSQRISEVSNSAEADVARNSKSKSARANDTKTESDKF